MNKTLFEKLTVGDESLTLKQSVINNIDRIFSSGGFLDADSDSQPGTNVLDSIYHNGVASVVEQSAMNGEQLREYRLTLAKVLLRFEPRLKNVTVSSIKSLGIGSSCRLKIELIDGEFEQDFVFA